MSVHKNVSDVELELRVDGHPFSALPGETVTIPDEFDYQLAEQPSWELVTSKSAPVAASTPEPVAASEGDN